MARYIAGIIGSVHSIAVRYIETTVVIPVAKVRSKINLDLTHFRIIDFEEIKKALNL